MYGDETEGGSQDSRRTPRKAPVSWSVRFSKNEQSNALTINHHLCFIERHHLCIIELAWWCARVAPGAVHVRPACG